MWLFILSTGVLLYKNTKCILISGCEKMSSAISEMHSELSSAK